jgi:hypothetical protein
LPFYPQIGQALFYSQSFLAALSGHVLPSLFFSLSFFKPQACVKSSGCAALCFSTSPSTAMDTARRKGCSVFCCLARAHSLYGGAPYRSSKPSADVENRAQVGGEPKINAKPSELFGLPFGPNTPFSLLPLLLLLPFLASLFLLLLLLLILLPLHLLALILLLLLSQLVTCIIYVQALMLLPGLRIFSSPTCSHSVMSVFARYTEFK